MNILKKLILGLAFIMVPLKLLSQDLVTLPPKKVDITAQGERIISYFSDKFVSNRPLYINMGQVSPYNFTAKTEKNVLVSNRMEDFRQLKISTSLPIAKLGPVVLGVRASYEQTYLSANVTNPNTQNLNVFTERLHYLSGGFNASYYSKFFGKTAIYSANVSVDGSEKALERLKGGMTVFVVWKMSAQTKFTTGINVDVNPSTQFPVVPLVTYEHRFNSEIIVDAVLPLNIYIRKFVFHQRGRISLGTELEKTSFYLYDITPHGKKYEYRQWDPYTGILYEHGLGQFVLSAKLGIKETPSGRLFEKSGSASEPVYTITSGNTSYFSVGISLNPYNLIRNRVAKKK